MANKFDNPKEAYNECSDYGGQLTSCTGQFGTLTECMKNCPAEKVVEAQAFKGQSGRKVKRVPMRRSSQVASNEDFMLASGRGKAMSDFLHEVGIIMIGVGGWFFIAAPLLKKIGVKPLSL